MTAGLERRYGLSHRHFITFSCFQRRPYLATDRAYAIFEDALEKMRAKYSFRIDSYVLMPEHVHLLVTEPSVKNLSVAIQALKISVSRRLTQRPFWHHRFYDFNVYSDAKQIEKRQYIHRNPCIRGFVSHPKDWPWSSYRHWAYGEPCKVQIDSAWAYELRMRHELIHKDKSLDVGKSFSDSST